MAISSSVGKYAEISTEGGTAPDIASSCCAVSRTQALVGAGGLAAAAVVAVVVVVATQGSSDPCAWSNYRLPEWVTPTSYDITWAPSMQPGGPLTGTVTMQARIAASQTGCIIMHSDGFEFDSILFSYTNPDGSAAPEA
jgi:hypothetical protein